MSNALEVTGKQRAIETYFAQKVGKNKDVNSRVKAFIQYMRANDKNIYNVSLSDYRDYLLERMSERSVKDNLTSVRKYFKAIMRDRDALFKIFGAGQMTTHEVQSAVNEFVTRLELKITDENAFVKVARHQDGEVFGKRLTPEQIRMLLSMPDIATLKGKRDKALISLLLATGIRRTEASNLTVANLNVVRNNVPCCEVIEGKGKKSRLIPYGSLLQIMTPVQDWLDSANITDGIVLRRVFKSDKVGDENLSAYGIQTILNSYPLEGDGETFTVNPHDLRRTYARMCYDSGMELLSIKQNLGHADVRTTELYIGANDLSSRQPKIWGLG